MKVKTSDIIKLIEDAQTMIDIQKLTPDVNLRDVGADSLDMMNILLAIQEQYGFEVPDEDIYKVQTINEICKYVNTSTDE